jgi:hypothetical protein
MLCFFVGLPLQSFEYLEVVEEVELNGMKLNEGTKTGGRAGCGHAVSCASSMVHHFKRGVVGAAYATATTAAAALPAGRVEDDALSILYTLRFHVSTVFTCMRVMHVRHVMQSCMQRLQRCHNQI